MIVLPHLGASTREAEENCAVMVADQLRDYLIDGTITNSVNFPDVVLPRESPVAGGHRQRQRAEHGRRNLPRDGRGRAEHRHHDQQVPRRSGLHVVDVDSDVPAAVIEAIAAIDGVLKVRYLPAS